MNKEEIKIITLGDIFENIETEEKAFRFKDYVKNLQDENERLNNIINELEKYLKEESKYDEYKDVFYREHMGYVLDKLKELKEGNK